MRFNNFFNTIAFLIFAISFIACNSGGGSTPPSVPGITGLPNGQTLTPVSGSNVMSFTVNGSDCTIRSTPYENKPCVTVTICNPGSTTVCQTVKDILLDTGSYGLRVFKAAIPNLTLTQVISRQGGSLAECVKFGDETAEWGPVQRANVTLGSETASNIPIQVIDDTFGTIPQTCSNTDANANAAGFNGILGVGLFPNDCGDACNGTFTGNGRYFNCVGSSCVGGTSNAVSDQTENPISAFPVDNNGVILELPAISNAGAASVSGYLIFGIGTESNNVPPSTVTAYTADTDGYFRATFNGSEYTESFIDSGSNGLFFDPSSDLTACPDGSGWLCPSGVLNHTVVTQSAPNTGSNAQTTVNFQIGDASQLFGAGVVFNDLGGDGGAMFDFGLPFYFGRNIYHGIDGSHSSLGNNGYWAY